MSKTNDRIESPVLESAWQRYAEFDSNAQSADKQRSYVREAGLIVATLVVLLEVFENNIIAYVEFAQGSIVDDALKVALILALVVSFILLAVALRFQQGESF